MFTLINTVLLIVLIVLVSRKKVYVVHESYEKNYNFKKK